MKKDLLGSIKFSTTNKNVKRSSNEFDDIADDGDDSDVEEEEDDEEMGDDEDDESIEVIPAKQRKLSQGSSNSMLVSHQRMLKVILLKRNHSLIKTVCQLQE